MLKSFVTAVALTSAATVVLVLILLGSIDGPVDTARADPQGSVDLVAIDMDTAGNDDTTVGTIENCAEIPNVGTHNEAVPAAGTSHTFDLVVKGVDPGDKIKSYQFDIDYDETVIEIIGVKAVDGTPTGSLFPGGLPVGTVTMISRIDTWGGAGFLNASEIAFPINDLADDDGSLTVAAADGTDQILGGGHPPAGHESGDGVLARITVRGIATGQSPLTIPGPKGGQDGNPDTIIEAGDGPLVGSSIPVEDFEIAAVSVNQPCVDPSLPPADVQISGLDCVDAPGVTGTEVVAIKNYGGQIADLTGWKLRSDPVATQVFELSTIHMPGYVPGRLGGENEAYIWSGSGADGARDELRQFTWDKTEKFRNGDATDFAQIVDNTGTVIDQVNCIAGPATPTPTPTRTPTPTPTGTPTSTPTVKIFEKVEGVILRDVGKPLTTDSEGDGATADDPVETTVTPPSGGSITLFNVVILETEITEPSATGFTFFGQEVNITVKPPATAANPLKVAFLLDGSITEGEDKDTIQIFKDGVQVAACTDTSGTASPDPCVSSRKQVGDDIELTVLTSTASLWDLGRAQAQATPTPTGTVAATPTPTPTGTVADAATPGAPPAAGPRAAPSTGDGIPVDEGGGAPVLSWLLVGLGVVIAMAATGYVAYSARGRFASARATTRRRLSH